VPIQCEVVEKPFWPVGEISPWAEDDQRPTPLQVARCYPTHLLAAIGSALFFGIFITAFVCWVLNVLLHAVLDATPFSSTASLGIAWLAMSPALVWLDLYAEIRGWLTWDAGV
jgi:hypothetical protein